MGPNMAFDEGGVACRSRFCPVRQHNKDKPDKCRVDFFMLCDSKYYFIYHMDVHQGKNKHNSYIHKHAADLPTTQKAVMNSIFKTDLSTPDPLGYRHLASDNRCNCPELLCVLRDKCRICGTGTCRKKRKGWDASIHCMLKDKSIRGKSVLSYDTSNRIICGEWMDSKVVNFATSLVDTTSSTVQRRIGSQRKVFPCPTVLTHYQQTMGGVDKGDQMRLHGGGFARKAHYKKWYKKAFFAVADCMLLNSLIAWNLSCKERRNTHRRALLRHDFYAWVAESMMQYQEPCSGMERSPEQVRQATAGLCFGTEVHRPRNAPTKSRCAVCKLDCNYEQKGEAGVMDNTHVCSELNCDRIAHSGLVTKTRKIHTMEVFTSMTCFEIMHSVVGREIWAYRESFNGRVYSVNYGHPVVQDLRVMHGHTRLPVRRRRSTNQTTQSQQEDPYQADTEETQTQN